jgi:cyclopropane fatty-acyl-phospholipid synthase-like methyltransferase
MAGFRQRFALAMHERSHVLASVTIDSFRLPPNAGRFLDIGGGAGSYSVALAQRYARLEGVVVDQSVTIARHLIRKEGLAQRIRVRQGNVLTMPFPSPVDVALMSNLVHDFGKQDNKLLLSRVRQALRPGGKLFIVEFFLNSDRTAPVDAAVFSLLMHAFTGTGRAYAWNEVEAWLRATGFGILRRRLITGNIGTLEAVKLSRRD